MDDSLKASVDRRTTRTYYAKSVWTSKINWVAVLTVIVNILTLQDFLDIIPPPALPYINAAALMLITILRTTGNTRPVAFIRPGASKPVQVKALSLVLVLLFGAACATNHKPRTVEVEVAADATQVAAYLRQLSDGVMQAQRDAVYTAGRASEIQAQLRGTNALGISLSDHLKRASDTADMTVRTRELENAGRVIDTMAQRMVTTEALLSEAGRAPPEYLVGLARSTREMLAAMSLKIKGRTL